MKRFVILALLAVGCGGDLDPEWQLDHDRVIAVRATPPSIVAGGRSELDGLIAGKDFICGARLTLADILLFGGKFYGGLFPTGHQ